MANVYQLNPPRGRPQTPPEIVDFIIATALKLKASDIHLGLSQPVPGQEPYLLRFRINGKLQMVRSDFMNSYYKETISRFKVLAGMNITDTMVPQDGQIHLNSAEGQIVLRVATVPSLDSEDVVIRVQRNERPPKVDQLMMAPSLQAKVIHLIKQRSGMIILNGPAGSGKTTTIYSLIAHLASPERKIITAEDPIETRLHYVSHTQVTPKTSFASLCRSFMRQDADVIFIGEVRDHESAEAAVQLAQTGHLVLTTLHTRDAIGVVPRLEALSIDPTLIGTTLIGSLAQRLVPKICDGCKQAYIPDKGMLKRMYRILSPPAGGKFYRQGVGCDKCIAGVTGRIPIFELFVPDAEISDMISRSSSKAEILERARAKGMRNLAEDALARVYEGQVDLNSVYSFVFGPEFETTAPANQASSSQQAGNEATRVILKTG